MFDSLKHWSLNRLLSDKILVVYKLFQNLKAHVFSATVSDGKLANKIQELSRTESYN